MKTTSQLNELRSDIAQQTADFLAAGGKVKKYAVGVSVYSKIDTKKKQRIHIKAGSQKQVKQ